MSVPRSADTSTTTAAPDDDPTALRAELERLRIEARHGQLTQRDYAVGVNAELQTERTAHQRARQQLATARGDLALAREQVQLLKEQLASTRKRLEATREEVRTERKRLKDIRSSRTWRIGQAIGRPFRALRGGRD
jgi:chromosome segregation ATPase